jgi:hypothetical protein
MQTALQAWRRSIPIIAAALCITVDLLAGWAGASDRLEDGFRNPPESARPWVYWWWLDGGVSRDGITRDLEAMKQQGIAGALLFDAGEGGPRAPKGPRFMSPAWCDLFRFAVAEAHRVGITLSINLCSGWNAGGPWVQPRDAAQKVVHSQVTVRGPVQVVQGLPQPPTVGNYYRDIAVLAYRFDGAGADRPLRLAPGSWMDLSARVVPNGRLAWKVPDGSWLVIRLGTTLVQGQTKFTSPGCAGLEIDPMSAAAMDRHFDATAEILLAAAGSLGGKTLTHTHIDSWEIAEQPTWTPDLAGEFRRRNGYDRLPYLPALVGKTVENKAVTERFLWDYRRLVADLVADNYYGRLAARSRQHGLGIHPESGGPFVGWHDELANLGRSDVPMGEFWYPAGAHADFSLKQAACAAHTYGKRICQAEAFTDMGPNWEESPRLLKLCGDRAFCQGLNRNVLCFYVHQVDDAARPGYQWEMAGTHFDRHVTWWRQSSAWLTYLARCQFLLQQGLPVADFCYYYGQDVPASVPYRDKLSPAMPAGYDYDVCNTEVLCSRMSVRNGKLVLPDGVSYEALVLPDRHTMTPQVLDTVKTLTTSGATVLGPRPDRSPSLQNYPQCDDDVRRRANALWGAGKVIAGRTIEQILRAKSLTADFKSSSTSLSYVHRRSAAEEIYFVSNQSDQPVNAECTFRATGRQPELWDPVRGEIEEAHAFRQHDRRTTLPLALAPCGSIFVLFRKPCSVEWSEGRNFPALDTLLEIKGPWALSFDPKWGGPEAVVFDQLVDWTKRSDEGIKYYSGTARYRTRFDLDNVDRRLWLDLGEVRDVAEVRLNGTSFGVVWTQPFRVKLNGIVRKGENDLEVLVTNLWPNRLIGDARLPRAQRFTRTNVEKFDHPPKEGGEHQLLTSGLLGPVTIMLEQR